MWNSIDSPVSILRVINEKLTERQATNDAYFPSFRGTDTLFVGSDYSGEHPESKYLGFTVVILPAESWRRWDAARAFARDQHALGRRRMAYSRLGDRRRRMALGDFMTALMTQGGIVTSLVVNKGVKSLFDPAGQLGASEWAQKNCPGWKRNEVEKMLRVVNFVAFFVAGVVSAGQDVRWFTDHDAIVANEGRFHEMAAVWRAILNTYLTVVPRSVFCSTSFESTLEVEDFVAIPDLIGGALVDLFNAHRHRGEVLAVDRALPHPEGLAEKAENIVNYLAAPGMLRRLVFTVEPGPQAGTVEISEINLAAPSPGA